MARFRLTGFTVWLLVLALALWAGVRYTDAQAGRYDAIGVCGVRGSAILDTHTGHVRCVLLTTPQKSGVKQEVVHE